MSDRPQTAPAIPAAQAAPGGSPAGEWAGHPTPPVFEPAAFLLALVGLLGAVGLVPVVHPLLADRLAIPPQLATGLTAAAAAAFGAAAGAVVAWRWRRLGFYEISAAGLVWALVTTGLALRAAAGGGLPQVVTGLAVQGTLVLVLVLLGLGAGAAAAVLTGTSLGYLAAGTGRLDASLSYELYVARSHLRLSPRTLAALFALVVTGILPGLLVGLAWSLIRTQASGGPTGAASW